MIFINRLILSFALLLVFGLLVAPSAHAQLLWEITGKKLKKPSYLYGTMHIADPRVFEFSPAVMDRFSKCDVFAGELLLHNNQLAMLQIIPMMMMPNDTTLETLLTKEEYAVVQQRLDEKFGKGDDSNQMLKAMFDRIKPMFTAFMLSEQESGVSMEEAKSKRLPLDLFFQDTAAQMGMEVMGLETIREQMEAFNSIPLEEQAKMLYQQAANPEKNAAKSQLEEMIRLYTSQDLEGLQKLTATEIKGEMNDKLLIERNVRMADRMEEVMKKKPVFVGVGVAHLPGQEGIIELLRKKGYKVNPVK